MFSCSRHLKTYRDWVHIELENRSTMLRPRIELFDKEKSNLGAKANKTPGANLSYHFVAPPNTRFMALVKSQYGESTGAYLFRVVATKSYDAYEPNDNILEAREISPARGVAGERSWTITTGIFSEWWQGQDVGQIEINLVNRSTTLRPRIELFDASKSHVGAKANKTPGGDLTASFKITPEKAYHLEVRDQYLEAAGAYHLIVRFKP